VLRKRPKRKNSKGKGPKRTRGKRGGAAGHLTLKKEDEPKDKSRTSRARKRGRGMLE